METWTVVQAKAKFSELIDLVATDGPQTITRNGKSAAVIVSVQDWEQKAKRIGNLAEFFAGSPLRGSELKTRRVKGGLRKAGL